MKTKEYDESGNLIYSEDSNGDYVRYIWDDDENVLASESYIDGRRSSYCLYEIDINKYMITGDNKPDGK